MSDTRLRKQEVLRGKTEIDRLFAEGRSGFAYPVRYVRTAAEAEPGTGRVEVLFSAPKKRLRRAWMRNRIKRLMREAYRLNKRRLTEKTEARNKAVRLGLIYSSTELEDYRTIENALRKILDKIAEGI